MIRAFTLAVSAILIAGCMTQPPAPTVDRSTSPKPAAAVPGGPGYYTVKKGDTLYRIALEHGQDYKDVVTWNSIANPNSIKEGQVLRVTPPVAAVGEAVVAQPVVTMPAVESRPLDGPSSTASAAGTSQAASASGAKREPRGGKEPYSDEAYARLNRSGETAAKPLVVATAEVPASPKVEPKPEVKPEPKPESKPDPEPAAAAGPDDVAWQWPSSGKVILPFTEMGNKGIDIGGKPGDPVLAAADGKVVYVGTGIRGFGQLLIVKHNATFLSAYAHNRKMLVSEGQQVTRGQKIAEMGNTDSDIVKLHFEIRKQGKPIDPLVYLPRR